jgi:hypothetical protein
MRRQPASFHALVVLWSSRTKTRQTAFAIFKRKKKKKSENSKKNRFFFRCCRALATQQMLHSGCNLPPLMKRDQWRHWTTRVQQDLAHLQSVESTRLQTNAHLPCTMTHKVESHLGNFTARSFDFVGG